MIESSRQENQQELFLDFKGEARKTEKMPPMARSNKPIFFSITLEQIILGTILLILFFCFVFWLGVLRGRSASHVSIVETSVARSAPVPVPAPKPARPVEPAINTQTAVVPKKVSAAKPYTLQLLTTKKKQDAEDEAVLLRKKGFDSWSARSGNFYIVCLGRYSGKEEAARDLNLFSSRYKGCYLRRG